ncbi:MAG: hypothetical protein IBJ11_12260 [Phycisphaerales bacterium]|nr:hypothetical protein [Phycisphaerales bacterium]
MPSAMELDAAVIFWALVLGTAGLAVTIYGKKAQCPRCVALGVAMMVTPYFTQSAALEVVLLALGLGSWRAFALGA